MPTARPRHSTVGAVLVAALAVVPAAQAFTPEALGALARATPRAPCCRILLSKGCERCVGCGASALALSRIPKGPALEPMRGGSKSSLDGARGHSGVLAPQGAVPRAPFSRLLPVGAAAAVVVAAVACFPSAAWAAKAAAGGAGAAATTAGSLIRPADEWGLWATLIVCAAAGLRAEKTEVGAKLSSPLVTMFLALLLVNIGVLPPDAPLYGAINKFLVPLAVPMLLLGADLRRVFRDTGSLLLAFLIGSVATTVSIVIAAAVLPMHGVDGAWKIAAALCSRHIGGAINYVAVSDVLQAPPASITAGIAADNLVVAIFFITLFAIANQTPCDSVPQARMSAASAPLKQEKAVLEEEGAGTFNINQLASALAISASVCLVAEKIVVAFSLAGWSIPIATTLIIILATLFPAQLSGLKGAGEAAGVLCMQLFFAATGAAGSIRMVLATAPVLLAFSALHLVLHLGILLGLGRLFYRFVPEDGRGYRDSVWWNKLLVASNANVGGPTTAAGMATAKRWRSLIVPALLVGVFGYAIATFVSVVLGRSVLQALMAPPL